MFVVFALRKSETRKSSALGPRANCTRVNWYGRCFWCSAAGQPRDVQTRESDRIGDWWLVAGDEWLVAGELSTPRRAFPPSVVRYRFAAIVCASGIAHDARHPSVAREPRSSPDWRTIV